jgi:arylsulfatase
LFGNGNLTYDWPMDDTAGGHDGTVREARRRPCLAAAGLALAGLAAAGCGSRPAQGPPNVLWIVIDAQRADHLGCYGHDRDTSPFLDALAAEGLRFTNAISQESYTQASVPSYFTSTYPLQHRVLYDQPTIDVLAPRFLTIAETLKTAGYTTAAFVFNPHLKARFGFGQGFDLYDDDPAGWPEGVPLHEAMETARKIHRKLEGYLTENPTRPLFLYLHYRDVHSPYAPPPPFHELFLPAGVEPAPDLLYTERPDRAVPHTLEVVLSQYDGEIRYTDTQLRETLRLLERFGITRTNSVIVITADHGEEFHDRHPDDPGGLYHGRTLYGEQIRVPLILLLPDVRPARRVIDAYVELVDVVPTVLDAAGIDWKRFGQFRGTSLLPLIEHGEAPERTVYAGGNHGRGILIAGDWKYYRYDEGRKHDRKRTFHRPLPGDASEVGEELYNIREDPGETQNRIATRPDVAAELRRQLDDLEATMTAETEADHLQMDEQTRTQLEALGYL